MSVVTTVLIIIVALLATVTGFLYVAHTLRTRNTVRRVAIAAAQRTVSQRIDVITVSLSPTEVDALVDRHLDGFWLSDNRGEFVGHVYDGSHDIAADGSTKTTGTKLGFGVQVQSCAVGVATVTVFPYRRDHTTWETVENNIKLGLPQCLGDLHDADMANWRVMAEVRHSIRDELLVHLNTEIRPPQPVQPPLVSPFGLLADY